MEAGLSLYIIVFISNDDLKFTKIIESESSSQLTFA